MGSRKSPLISSKESWIGSNEIRFSKLTNPKNQTEILTTKLFAVSVMMARYVAYTNSILKDNKLPKSNFSFQKQLKIFLEFIFSVQTRTLYYSAISAIWRFIKSATEFHTFPKASGYVGGVNSRLLARSIVFFVKDFKSLNEYIYKFNHKYNI